MLPTLELVYDKVKNLMELYACYEGSSKILLLLAALDEIEDKYTFLDNVLNGKVQDLPQYVTNIGLVYNCYSYEDSPLPLNTTYDELSSYVFCQIPGSIRPQLTTWIYKQNGTYYLEITPHYPYTYRNLNSEEKCFSFEDFVKDYAPICKETMPQEKLEELRDLFAKATIEAYKNMYYNAMQALRETEPCEHMLADAEKKAR